MQTSTAEPDGQVADVTPSELALRGDAALAAGARIERLDYGPRQEAPQVSVIVPTLDGDRRGLLEQLLADLQQQTLRRFELLLVIGDSRQGRAINRGVAAARAPVVCTMDDDTIVGTTRLLESMLAVLERHPDVGMVGASTVLPPTASWFQRLASRQIPRRLFPIVSELTDSDMVQHPCLALSRQLFLDIGGEDEELIRGLDPILRHKVRRAGYRVAIAPHCYISHPLPEGFGAVLRMYFRNGRGSAFAQRHYPERVLTLGDGFEGDAFEERVSFLRRVVRYPGRMLRALCTGRWVLLAVQGAYSLGYLRERVSTRG